MTNVTHYFDHPLAESIQQMLRVSEYAARHLNILQALLLEDQCLQPFIAKDYQHLIDKLDLDLSLPAFIRELRRFRHRHLLRIALRECAGLADTVATMAAWSACADALILHALMYCERQLSARYGRPCHESVKGMQLYVLAMGKLGGQELNFSSDIDLIFAYSAAGYTDGAESISAQEYYTKMVQQFIQLIQQNTEDGFVFRVDLRLRPNGESGPLVCTLAAMETYYQEQGRDWERYAMVKARVVHRAGDEIAWFKRLIVPFVYRRYVDFSVIESLRGMKAMITREVQLNPTLDDIKRGQGGIREVEFIIQSFQLIRGGRIIAIRQQNALLALHALKQQKLLAHTQVLQQAYVFLRKLENMLQFHNDKQTHTLPTDGVQQAQLIEAMGYVSWQALVAALDQYRRIIHHAFHAVLGKTDAYEDEKRVHATQLMNVWQGHVETHMAVNLLASLGFNEAARCYQLLYAFRHGSRCRRLLQAARLRLDRFMVSLLHELAGVTETDVVLLQVIRLLENIVGRSAYLALLSENLPVLQELLHWFAHSPFISTLLVTQPFLLEVLIDQKASWQPLSRLQLEQILHARLLHCHDSEAEDEVLRQFKLIHWLLAARAELYGQCHAVRIGKFLSDVAEVIITAVVTRACEQLGRRNPEIMQIQSRFAIVAYGKLGSREMNYDSDVDLVFLHRVTPEQEHWVTRLSQKILHMLTTRSQAGVLYTVDTRLRPSGEAGLLVSHIDAFVAYQRTHAWTWEHQALLRARVLYAHRTLRTEFNHLKHDVLCLPRDPHTLNADVQTIRAKISKHLMEDNIKHMPGGLFDLEFLVQYLMLLHPDASLARTTHTLSQLTRLKQKQVLSPDQWAILTHAYRYFHQMLHRQLLQRGDVMNKEEQVNVARICQYFF